MEAGLVRLPYQGAADAAAKAANGGNASVGDNDANGVAADKDSVTGIAKGIKAIVEAAKEAGAGAGKEITLEQGKAAEADNKEAGKLFGTNGAGAAGAADVGKGAAAVTAASGQQILSAIVEAADTANGKGAAAVTAASGQQILSAIVEAADTANGKGAAAATNAVEAAIGVANQAGVAFGAAFGKRNDRIAAAIALRGMAKDGKFSAAQADGDNAANGVAADKDSVTGIAKGIKAIVEAAKEAGKEAGKEITLEQGKAAEADTNKEAGKLFGTNGNGASADDARKGAAAVTAASGQQILSAIVEAASSTEGKRAGDATNAVEAAIGVAGDAGDAAAFGADLEKRNDRIAAAIALRGMAKGGKFSAQAGGAAVKGAAGAAVAGSVTGIAKGIKTIVKAAKAADGKGKKADEATNAVEAAIGVANQAGVAFGADLEKRNDRIAAAIALRGMAKGGKFSAAQADGGAAVKGAAGAAVAGVVLRGLLRG
ncbi:variable large family protein [Borreliella burgdorferi]|uniref:variable large family protein n=1 Tax=Borreliella burgdorferi TaxID=139 RepID=UPI001E60DDA6|nr:variable large family protein [Borreliella burgdorferi]MCD2410084.1 variable large family protein [Borreliella burgdorferi]MCD2415957.1 variable large family protein [Borreliella burgdorferi]